VQVFRRSSPGWFRQTRDGGKWGRVPVSQGMEHMKQWYVLYCKSQDAVKIARRVNALGVTSFYPLYVKVTKRKDCNSVRMEDKPLFPNYLFLQFDVNVIHTSHITKIPGAVGFVCFSAGPCVIPEKVVTAIQYARLVAMNKDEGAIECRNVSKVLLRKIQRISLINSPKIREIRFAKLLQPESAAAA
jgi:transcriptional antiterminator RfaH